MVVVKRLVILLCALLTAPFSSAFAGGSVFPVVCRPGVTCFILSYPDLARGRGTAQDYKCGPLAIDGDKSLRIGISHLELLREGVDVLAAFGGVVIDAQDGMDDVIITSRQQLKRGQSLCGNGIVIDHKDGTQSAYCHLRKGSLKVKAGTAVTAGDKIAQIGQSGYATWPQLGFSLQSGGVMIDPVTSMSEIEGCGFRPRPAIPLPPAFENYAPAAILNMGFVDHEVTLEDMRAGQAGHYTVIGRDAPQLGFWALIAGVRKGDEIITTLYDRRGRIFDKQQVIAESDEDLTPVTIYRSRGFIGWRAGTYTAVIQVKRTIKGTPYSVARRVRTTITE